MYNVGENQAGILNESKNPNGDSSTDQMNFSIKFLLSHVDFHNDLITIKST